MTPELVRLRADPAKVRISIRRCSGGWIGRVQPLNREAPSCFVEFANDPERAVFLALSAANNAGLPGIDLGCDWAYRHPQWRRP